MGWLESFKLAIITQDTKRIADLIEQMPQFETIGEMEEALYLIKEGYTLIDTLRSKTRSQIETIKKNIEFLESTAKGDRNTLDVSY